MLRSARMEWILFDADGTLFDYDAAEAAALSAAFARLGRKLSTVHIERYRRINVRYWRRFEAGLVSADELKAGRVEEFGAEMGLSADAEALSDCYLEELSSGTQLIAGAVEAVERCRRRFRVALITNGLARVQRPRIAASPPGRTALTQFSRKTVVVRRVIHRAALRPGLYWP